MVIKLNEKKFFYRVDHLMALVKISVTRMLTNDLFAVASLVLILIFDRLFIIFYLVTVTKFFASYSCS